MRREAELGAAWHLIHGDDPAKMCQNPKGRSERDTDVRVDELWKIQLEVSQKTCAVSNRGKKGIKGSFTLVVRYADEKKGKAGLYFGAEKVQESALPQGFDTIVSLMTEKKSPPSDIQDLIKNRKFVQPKKN